MNQDEGRSIHLALVSVWNQVESVLINLHLYIHPARLGCHGSVLSKKSDCTMYYDWEH